MSSYRCVFLMGVEQALEYRVSFFLSMLSAVFPIIIQTTMWNYLYRHSDAAAVFGYQQGEILLYTLLATIVSQLVGTGFEWEMNSDIKMGGLNKYLIRPVGYKGYQFFRFLGQKIPRIMVIGPVMAVIIGAAFWQGLPASPGRTAAFLVSLILGMLLNFSVFYCIGLSAFWLTDVDKLFGTISIVLTVVSGGVFPLDIFGGVVETLANLLPFGYTTQFPVNIINGRFGWARMGVGFAFQAGWILVFVCLGEAMWRRGIRRYAAVGG
ncbi:MAG: hypothetical protein HFH85_16415 [Lachnospiraceae bacterium]|nr:hypothetical protein [Lachnospiraceae bacterium]